jgi:hypothetical protein
MERFIAGANPFWCGLNPDSYRGKRKYFRLQRGNRDAWNSFAFISDENGPSQEIEKMAKGRL